MNTDSSDCSPQEWIKDIRRSALGLLARREHSYQELLTKLSRRYDSSLEIDRACIEEQLNWLSDQNLQSDERFVEAFVRDRQRKGKGPQFIRQELKQRGVDNELIHSSLGLSEGVWLDIAAAAYQKKFSNKPIVDQKEKARRIRFMQARGFSIELFSYLIEQHSSSSV